MAQWDSEVKAQLLNPLSDLSFLICELGINSCVRWRIFLFNVKPGSSRCSLNVSHHHSPISHHPDCLCGENK